ncbi:tubulin-specific chaperone, putative [Plasmodium sp. gorilla clade G2]|uniref:tubulin-specific chaperone, putative n=1 Tax=Plasmodium sp. gorilla clade G2 TaxID=880535 RepID=UPI000D20B4E5|nr:tubulin-specific chaperone, putative [Plasmodium sp. gorilla clade G2]SOV14006.1 tubulin-specific chaperone, putative [Plasmodium sp. gorilla clade G2]
MNEYVQVDFIHNMFKNKTWKEIKLNKFDSIKNIKKKIYTHTGTSYDNMNLYAYDENDIDNTQVFLSNDEYCLNDYNVKDNYIIYIQENNKTYNSDDIIYNLDDEQKLQKLAHLKYTMNDDEYDKRPDNIRNFLKKLREKNKTQTNLYNQQEEGNNKINDNDPINSSNIINNSYDQELYQIGKRCRIKLGDRRGILKFVGNIKNNNDIYVGVDLDEPLGNSDGMYKKTKLFECKGDKYGYIGNINSIEVGDFPPFDIMDMEEF